MKILAAAFLAILISGCAAAPEKLVATVPVSQTLIEVRYAPIRPDLTALPAAPPEAATFGDLWGEVKAYRALWAVIGARLACIAAIQDVPVPLAPLC